MYLGLDVGKGQHHACALDPTGKRLHDNPLPNDETDCGHWPTSSPNTARCWWSSTSPPRSARCRSRSPATRFVIADAARTLPHTLRRIDTGDETLAELEVPAGLELLSRFGGPDGLRRAGRRRLPGIARTNAPRIGERLVDDIWTALDAQTITVPGTAAAEAVLPRLTDPLRSVPRRHEQIADEVENMPDAHPLTRVLTSRPGFEVPAATRVRLEAGDGSASPTAGHPAAYAGLAPVTRHTGSSIRGERPQGRQQAAGTRHFPGRVRIPDRPGLPGLLPAQTRPG